MDINVPKHEIDHRKDNFRLVQSAPYRGRPTAIQFAAVQINQMLAEGVTVVETTERQATVTFPSKKIGSLCIYADYRSLNAVRSDDPYRLYLMNQQIKIFGKATKFSSLDAN